MSLPKLSCELVPSNQWGTNLRSVLVPAVWDALRKACYERAGHRCEICNGVGKLHPVECHETWEYTDGPVFIQKLTGLIALCPACHKVKHLGFALSQGKRAYYSALGHLKEVNGWSEDKLYDYVATQFQIHAIRSQQTWIMNLDWLDNSQTYIEETSTVARQTRSQHAQDVIRNMTRNRAHD